jgi:DtxR family Mn-dependent transcriptional regulator
MPIDTHVTTESEEMYLITIARAIEDGSEPPIAVSDIARELDVSSVSANQMIKKLSSSGLVDYLPYKGVSLTDEGSALARSVLRNRRLWGLFLSEHLGLSPEHADEVACEMEHITPDVVADRLAAFLGDPGFGPTGKPIPSASPETSEAVSLSAAPTGVAVAVVSVAPPFDGFLASKGAGRGAVVTVVASAADGTVVIDTSSGAIELAGPVAAAVRVSPAD